VPKGYSVSKILTVLRKAGFVVVAQKGSHRKLRKIGPETLTVIVPIHKKDIPYGTFRSILRQSKLTEKEFK
jgi:predicted RNA binding protein YcfA (HicA-like mRNA interferase family)